MIKRIVCGLAVLSLSALVWGAEPFAGTWKLDVAKSTFRKGRELKECTRVVVEQGDDAVVTDKCVAGDGTPFAQKWSVPRKGGPMTHIEGFPPNVTGAAKRVDSNTIDFTFTITAKDGTVSTETAHATLNADGKTQTVVRRGADPKGPILGTEISHRQ